MQAAIGCAQMEKLPEFTRIRRENWAYLREQLAELDKYFYLPQAAENSKPSWFGFLLTLKADAPFSRVDLVKYIESKNIQTRLLFSGNILKHPCFDEMRASGEGFRVVGSLENTDNIMNNSFWIGVYPGMTRAMLDAMVKTIREFVTQHA